MDVKVLFLWIQILSRTSNSFRWISIFLDLRLQIKIWNIPNLEIKFIWYKPLNHFPNFFLWESSNTFIQIQISFWIQSNQPPKIQNSNSYSFSALGPVRDAAHPSLPPLLAAPAQRRRWPTRPCGPTPAQPGIFLLEPAIATTTDRLYAATPAPPLATSMSYPVLR
jgi:hypothetical protein